MEKSVFQNENYCTYDYKFEKTTVRYVVMKKNLRTFMYLVPNEYLDIVACDYETTRTKENGFPDNRDWTAGSIVHLHICGDAVPTYANTLKFSESMQRLEFQSQNFSSQNGITVIETILMLDGLYSICHSLKKCDGENGFEIKCTFANISNKIITLEMITSATIENLSPFNADANSENLIYHTFKSGWGMEGRHIRTPLNEIGMDKAWGGSFENVRIGSVGSKSTRHFFPYVALEDTAHNCTWGLKLRHNATWQAELSRCGTPLSLSIGLGDVHFGAWCKNVAPGECFETPSAYIAAVSGDIADVSAEILKMEQKNADQYGEKGLPTMYNDWALHCGDTSYDKMISLANKLKHTDIKYFILDDGWQTGGVGDWEIDYNKFPKGIKAYADEIREKGMIPGIWMEFENVRNGAKRFSDEYDSLCLKLNGKVLNEINCDGGKTKFLDFRKKEVIEYLKKTVIDFLLKNDIGYIKVDYNSNIGYGCDGAESLGEGLRLHMEEVYEFFKMIKIMAPDVIVESCSTGGARLDGKMMEVSAMSSVSDAIECIELPVIAANMQYLLPTSQSQIWCVVNHDYNENRIKYSIAAGFLGRVCWSGNIDKLDDWQFEMILNAENLYKQVSHIIKSGTSRVFRTDSINLRNPKGTQVVLRYSDDRSEILAVCHYMNGSVIYEVDLGGEYEIVQNLYSGCCEIQNNKLVVKGKNISADVLYLKRATHH